MILRHAWFESPERYATGAWLIAEGVVPLLTPPEPARQERWRSILESYGSREVPPPTDSATLAHPRDGDFWVVYTEVAYAAVAGVFAAARQARLEHSCDVSGLAALVEAQPPSVLVLFAPPSVLDPVTLTALKRVAQCPMGVVTARDLPSISFIVAKGILAAGAPSLPTAVLDAIFDRALLSGGERPLGDLSAREIADQLTAESWDTLVISSHADGGHTKIGRTLLCGVPGDHELDPRTGEPVRGGCRNDKEQKSCRRLHEDRLLIPIREIRARRIDLLSCTGLFFGEDSDVSIALALAEGYGYECLSTLRGLRADPVAVEMARLLREAKASPATIMELLDEAHERQHGFRLYALLGDPGRVEPLRQSVPDAHGQLEPLPAPVVEIGSLLASARVMRASSDGERPVIVRTATRTVVGGVPGTRVRLEDASQELDEVSRTLKRIGQTLPLLSHFERMIGAHYSAVHNDPTVRPEFLKLIQLRTATQQAEHFARWALNRVRDSGVWNDELDANVQELHGAVQRWDAHFASLLLSLLFGGEFDRLFDQYSGCRQLGERDPCARCGAPTYHDVRDPSIAGLAHHHRLTCLCCGLREVWREDGLRLSAPLPLHLVAGEPVELCFRHHGRPNTPTRGVLVLVTDKGRGKPFGAQTVPCGDEETIVSFTVPSDVTPGLHTTTAAWVAGLDVAIFRFRVPRL
jgi:hypothetical protein